MKKHFFLSHRLLCLFVCGALCLGVLAGCGAPTGPQTADPAVQPAVSQQKEAVVDRDHPLGLGAIKADAQLDRLIEDVVYYKHALGGNKLWVWGNVRGTGSGHSTYSWKNDGTSAADAGTPAIACLSVDGTPGQALPLSFPALDGQLEAAAAQKGVECSLQYELFDSDGEYPLLVRTWFTYPDEENWQDRREYRVWLCGVDATGSVSEGVELDIAAIESGDAFTMQGVMHGLFWVQAAADDPDRAVNTLRGLYGFDPATGEMKKQYEFEAGYLGYQICAAPQNRILVLVFEMDPAKPGHMLPENQRVFILDFIGETGTLLQTAKPPVPEFSFLQFVHTTQPGEEVLLWSNNGLYCWDIDENVYTLLHDRVDMGMADTPADVYCVNGEDFFLTVGHVRMIQNSTRVTFEIWLLGDEAAIPPDERPVITVGALAADRVKIYTAVEAFNKASPDLRAEMVAYTPAAAKSAGLESPQELLQRDILQGTAPDIVTGLYGTDLRRLIDKGALMDLYPLLDADTELSREDFVAGPLAAGTVNGGLYGIIPEYTILTAVGSTEVLGGSMGWTAEEFDALTAGMSMPYYGLGRSTQLWYRFQAYGSRFIDYAAGRAQLDTPEFAAILESLAACPETMGLHVTEDLKPIFDAGNAAAAICFVTGFDGVKNDVYTFNGPVTYKGFAGAQGSGSLLSPGVQLSIRSGAQDPQAAWKFVRYLLSEAYQSDLTNMLPLRRDALAAKAAEAQQPYIDLDPTDGVLHCIPSYLDQATTNQNMIDYWTRGLTPEETDKIIALAEATDQPFLFDDVVLGILTEESSAFFAGAATAEAAAAVMQNRIQTYLSEQR